MSRKIAFPIFPRAEGWIWTSTLTHRNLLFLLVRINFRHSSILGIGIRLR